MILVKKNFLLDSRTEFLKLWYEFHLLYLLVVYQMTQEISAEGQHNSNLWRNIFLLEQIIHK